VTVRKDPRFARKPRSPGANHDESAGLGNEPIATSLVADPLANSARLRSGSLKVLLHRWWYEWDTNELRMTVFDGSARRRPLVLEHFGEGQPTVSAPEAQPVTSRAKDVRHLCVGEGAKGRLMLRAFEENLSDANARRAGSVSDLSEAGSGR
jgi:hypothetical protein